MAASIAEGDRQAGRAMFADVPSLVRFVRRHARLFVLTGAGASTESGIPAYRDADGQWLRAPPMRIDEFVGSAQGYRRYWHRSMQGWPPLAQAKPNAAHTALARLGAQGGIEALVTQNVDGLHGRAGSTGVIELHGDLRRVLCLGCGDVQSREFVQDALERENGRYRDARVSAIAPDGDAEVVTAHGEAVPSDFTAPSCAKCGGRLKPDVVFFGESVPRQRVDAARAGLERADAMLVVGSSLTVYSGYRFCEWAAKMGKPVAAVNIGRTRADPLLALKVERACGETLTQLVDALAT